jgi:hypothetical protein
VGSESFDELELIPAHVVQIQRAQPKCCTLTQPVDVALEVR